MEKFLCFWTLVWIQAGGVNSSWAAPAETELPQSTLSQETAPSADDGQTEIEIDTDEEKPLPVKKSQKRSAVGEGRIIHGKDTEGSKALNRFKGDSVLQSQYRLNGRSLEVDPD